MRKLLNTLYIITPDYTLSKDGNNLVIKSNHIEIARFPANILEDIVSFTYSGLSKQVLSLCTDNGINLSFMSNNGRFIGSFNGPTHGNVLLRRKQYRLADSEQISLYLSKQFITAKLYNSLKLLKDGSKDHREKLNTNTVDNTVSFLKQSIETIDSIDDINSLRSLEGLAAKHYFEALDQLILINKNTFFIDGRNRRPPRDKMNSMMSFMYSVLMNDVRSSIETVGLDPYVGFMHTDRPGKPSLALDMMEEFRPFMDRLILNIVNLKKINENAFITDELGSVMLNDKGRAILLDEWQKKKWSVITHDYIQERLEFGLVPFVQSNLLAKYIKGDSNSYVPFLR